MREKRADRDLMWGNRHSRLAPPGQVQGSAGGVVGASSKVEYTFVYLVHPA